MPKEQQTNEANDRNLGKKKLAGYDEANNKVPHVLIQEGYLCPCPAAMSAHSFFPVIPKLDSLGQEGSKVA